MYSALAGFSIPTQRALIMLIVVMGGVYLQRKVRPLNTLVTALFVVCLVDPLSVLSAGFWLSFLAVTLIVYSLAGRIGRLSYWRSMLKIQWVAAIGLAPLVIFYFQQVSIIAPVANLIAVPIISIIIVPLALLGVMLTFIWPTISALLLGLLDFILYALLWVLSALSELPFATLDNPGGSVWVMLLALTGSFILLVPKGFPGRWLGLVLFFPLLFARVEAPKPGAVKMTLLDVGQGLSAVIQTAKHTLVFDTGAKVSVQFDMGTHVLLPFLRAQNIDKIDKLIISHSDNDHIGGADSLLQGIGVDQVVCSVTEPLEKYSPVLCRAGQSWQWDGVNFTMLAPGEIRHKGENNQSCVLRIASEHGNILLTGDIENEAEQWLVDEYATHLQAEILIAPHHGSKTSSTLPFLHSVNPDYILISAGYRNRFGFPHTSVLQNYRKINAEWLNTADAGAIIVRVDEKAITVESFREQEAKYWHKKYRRLYSAFK
jgi:competence protein ComEC